MRAAISLLVTGLMFNCLVENTQTITSNTAPSTFTSQEFTLANAQSKPVKGKSRHRGSGRDRAYLLLSSNVNSRAYPTRGGGRRDFTRHSNHTHVV